MSDLGRQLAAIVAGAVFARDGVRLGDSWTQTPCLGVYNFECPVAHCSGYVGVRRKRVPGVEVLVVTEAKPMMRRVDCPGREGRVGA